MDSELHKFASFNCKNVKRSIDNIRDLCQCVDVIALQETWLLSHEISYLNSISDDFNCTGTSAVDSTAGMLRGRPYGGVALLWRRSIYTNVTVIPCANPRVSAIKIVMQNRSILVFSIYMPTDAVCNVADFTDVLGAVSAIIDSNSTECVYVLGDFNAHPTERFYDELMGFCSEQDWLCIDTERLGITSNTYTFISQAHGSSRWLDHCLVTKASAQTVKRVYVQYGVLWSDHFPLIIECDLDIIVPMRFVKSQHLNSGIVWGERDLEQIKLYNSECHKRLRIIDFPEQFRDCCDHMCTDVDHGRIIDTLYGQIIEALSESSVVCQHVKKRKRKVVIGWNKHVADAHRFAKDKFNLWSYYGKPTSGRYYDEMCESKRIFKSRLKWCQSQEDKIKMDILASNHLNKDFRGFWKNTNKLNHKPSVPVCVDGVSDARGIAELFKAKFEVKSPLGPSRAVIDVEPKGKLGVRVSARNIGNIIQSMSRGKSPGHDGLSIEHLRYAGPHLPRVLALLYNLCLSHAYLPPDMLKTIVVPVAKNKTGVLTDRNNYRPISLATIVSKVLDSVLDAQLNKHVRLHDNQFGFRPGLSTDSAILSVKHTVEYYRRRSTNVYACFLDLSSAFDLVSYDSLWNKLNDAKVPTEVVNIFKFWYGNQVNCVRWDGELSSPYGLESGVRQGGLSSPTLFNLYMDQLIVELSSTRVGCYIDGICVNNISYADDMVLLSASVCGLRKLVSMCERYASDHGLVYNVRKSVVMVFGAGGECPVTVPPVKINGVSLSRVHSFKYLGHILTASLRDDDDIERERRALSIRANMIACRFKRASAEVKKTLFRAFCSSFYTCSLWVHFTQKSYSALRVQYNNAFRVLMGLPRFCSASGMFAEMRVDCFYTLMRKRCASLVRRVRASPSGILGMIADRLDCCIVNRCSSISAGLLKR